MEPRAGWLSRNRLTIALVIAACEAVLVALDNGFSRWSVIALAVIFVALYLAWGRELKHGFGRDITWILAASQTIAVAAVVLASILGFLAFLLAGLLAVLVLVVLLTDRPGRGSSP
ncbi:MAG TPA: hypothetical protein VH306_02780 [Gaiellaceae bacterium]|jgi:hypothetical protein